MSVISHWFKKRRSTALGIIAFASSIGGTVFPVVFRNLLDTVGYARTMNLRPHPANNSCSFKWMTRIITSILILAMGITNLVCRSRRPECICEYALTRSQTIRRRLPPTTVASGLFNPKQFKSPAYTVYIASGIFALLGLFTGQPTSCAPPFGGKSPPITDARMRVQCSLSSLQVRPHRASRQAYPFTSSPRQTQEMLLAA